MDKTSEDIEVIENVYEQVQEPPLYKVVLLNDDYTSMEFVVSVLMNIFDHSLDESVKIMYAVHEKGRGVCGVYTYEIAETKAMNVHVEAKKKGFPLRVTIEEE